MSYQVQIEFSPVYELLISLQAFLNRPNHKTLDIGLEWVQQVKKKLPATWTRTISGDSGRTISRDAFIEVLLLHCPAKADVTSFLRWLSNLSLGEMYEILVPAGIEPAAGKFGDLGGRRGHWLTLLLAWNEAYFQHMQPGIIEGLCRDAQDLRQKAEELTAEKLVTMATNGLLVSEDTGIDKIVLIPQYHYSPWNVTTTLNTFVINYYPADVLPVEPGEPPKALTRLIKALGDESRLRILRFIGTEKSTTFADIVTFSGLTKGTVHHHLVALRAAGLVRLQIDLQDNRIYELNEQTFDTMTDMLRDFVWNE
jgi:DNA-binding transcriptional ArsR family regulator